MKYIVIEIQKTNGGAISTLVYSFDIARDAESKYHEILMYAAKSTLPMHGASLLLEDGRSIMHKAYYLSEDGTVGEEPTANTSERGE